MKTARSTKNLRSAKNCGGGVLNAPLSENQAKELAITFKVLSDPVRVRLLSLIAAAPDGEVCACDLVTVLDRSQPTISHHLNTLSNAGFLTRARQGTWIWYSIVPERINHLYQALRLLR